MKRLTILGLFLITLFGAVSAQAAQDIQVTVNSVPVAMNTPPVVEDGRTLVPIRPIANEMGLVLVWMSEDQTASLWNDDTMVRLKINSSEMEVNGDIVALDTAPTIINDQTYMPVRAILEAFGAQVDLVGNDLWIQYAPYARDDEFLNPAAQAAEQAALPENKAVKQSGKFFYSQPQSDWGFENNGRGYCWVCSYAMLISNVKGEVVTPAAVAAFNREGGGSGSYMRSHTGVVERFGVSFAPALAETSPYFARYEDWRGGTYLNVSSDQDVINALKEALDRNPAGVIVRYNGYPHSMVAVGYEGDTIYYNEPAYLDSEWVTFEQTCLKNYSLSDITFIQAIV